MNNDERIPKILSMLEGFAVLDFSKRAAPAGKDDELDAIIRVLNKLGDELHASGRSKRKFEARINHMMQTLLQYTLMDFSTPLEISSAGDELDAIAVGLNTLVEELRAANEVKMQYIAQLESQTKEIRKLNEALGLKNASLQASNNELDAFTYSVSHDLRTPLRAIHGYSRILLDEYAPGIDMEGKEMISSVMRNTKKMAQLIDDLLSFSKTGKREVIRRPVDMKRLVNDVLAELSSGQEIKAEVRVLELPPAVADRNLISHVFVNLISNALKYSSTQTHPKIEIGSRNTEGKVVYYVEDNGVGFDMMYYDKLFGVFQRLHSEEEFEGTGVGLALVKRIITRHGGEVWAESKLGKGARFSFRL